MNEKQISTQITTQTWQLSVKLRYLQRENQLVLQQLYISNLGNEWWQDVEIVNETKTNKVY